MSKKKKSDSLAAAYNGKVYDFCSKKKMILIIAICVVVALIAGALIRGVKFAIEFKGGTMLTYSYTGDLDIDAVDAEVEKLVDSNVNV